MSTAFTVLPYDRDDDLIEATRRDGAPRVRAYAPDAPAVVLGRGSDPAVELHVDTCLADGIAVRRRRGGGCAVVIDPGNAVVSVSRTLSGLGEIRPTFDAMTRALVDALCTAGIHGVEPAGTSDLTIGDRKVAGSCVYRALGLFFFSATLLVAPDLSLVERYLRHPPREPDYRRTRPHARFMGRIADRVPGLDAPELARRLERALGRSLRARRSSSDG